MIKTRKNRYHPPSPFSSSRFTDSKKYESVFLKCFDLEEERSGEICNACVLLVKRFLKLPPGSNRNWHHVVDARSGPGTKNLKNRNNGRNSSVANPDTPDKIKKKHVYRRKNKATVRKRNPSIEMSEFLDTSFWKK